MQMPTTYLLSLDKFVPAQDLITYSRRKRNKTDTRHGAPTLAQAADENVARVTKELLVVLPTPARPARGTRRSEVSNQVPRQLDFPQDEQHGRDIDKYAELSNNPLSRQRVVALAAVMGKEPPSESLPNPAAIIVSS